MTGQFSPSVKDETESRVTVMNQPSPTISLLLITFLLLQSFPFVHGQDPRCGSLITYRQHAVLLSEAPQCFRDGCGPPNSTELATSISSPCPAEAPCNNLWEIILENFQQNWCASCHGDVACRIGGWPVLNMSAACNFSPSDWIFSATGECCATGNEPFLIADWIETLCNGSEWRAPFNYYGGMAKEDWEEWIEPWNWTLQLQNTTTEQFASEPSCDSSSLLWSLGIENFTKVAGFIANAVFALFFKVVLGKNWGPIDKRYHWWAAILGGVSDYISTFSGNIGTALILWNTPGYQNTPPGQLILLLSSRPSVLGALCSIGIVAIIFEDGRYGSARTSRLEHSRLRQWAADTAASLAICELLLQISGSAYLGRTANVGRKKNFFHIGHLTPFWRGSEAQRMYAGGLIWTIFSPFTILVLLLVAYLQVQKLYHEGVVNPEPSKISKPTIWLTRKYLRFMNRFWENRWQHEQESAERQPAMAEAAPLTARLQPLGQVDPQPAQGTNNNNGEQPQPGIIARIRRIRAICWVTSRPYIRTTWLFVTGPVRWIINRPFIRTTWRFVTWPIRWLVSRPFMRTAWRVLTRPIRWLVTRPYMRTTSRILTSKPLHWLTTMPYLYIYTNDLRAQRLSEAQNQPIDPAINRRRRGLDAITRQVLSKYPPAQLRKPEDTLRDLRVGVTSFLVMLWVVIYIAQWLFWSGFVQSSGPR